MRTGILGGTFNPPHRGHLALAQTVLDLDLVDQVLLVPAAVPPHKAIPSETSEDRLAMTRLLAEEDTRISVDDIELRRTGPSFTIDTVQQLAAARPDDCFRLIIGSDMAKTFGSWRQFSALLRLAPPLVAERPNDVFASPADSPVPLHDFPRMTPEEAGQVWAGRFPMQPVDISSTKVRELFAAHASDATLLGLITPTVLHYIRTHALYD